MTRATRESGIDVIGNVPWGTHFCLFYETPDDLISVLIPYVRMGLENNELCVCITSDTFTADKFLERMATAIPDFNRYLESGQIELIPYTEWYVIDGIFDPERVNN
ncbi:MAG TPA: MEDS domain-containing protein, partial [Chitinispirillaceae bacterium]|nr:MEDS domain-containing protein [Chitinispirillaceae bacterium]